MRSSRPVLSSLAFGLGVVGHSTAILYRLQIVVRVDRLEVFVVFQSASVVVSLDEKLGRTAKKTRSCGRREGKCVGVLLHVDTERRAADQRTFLFDLGATVFATVFG